MSNGRRAADRRRERGGGGDFNDDELGTTPGAAPASPHNNYVEVDDEPDDEVSERKPRLTSREEDLPSLLDPSDVVDQARPQSTTPRLASSPRGQIIDEELPDAEKSFARELKRRPLPTDTRTNVKVEVTEIKEAKSRRQRLGGVLRLLSQNGEPTTTTTTLPIAVYPALLGRSLDADLHVDDPTISLRHAELGFDDDGFSLVDLGSRSGTLRNGVVVDGRVPLFHGDIIAVGKTELRFLRADAVPVKRAEPEPDPVVEALKEATDHAQQAPPEPRTATNIRISREQQAQLQRAAVRRRRAAIRQRALLVIGACALLAGAVTTVTFVYRAAFSDSAPAQIRHQVAVLLGEAKKLLQEGDVDAAHARVLTTLGLDAENAEAISLDRVVTTEMVSRDALQLGLRMGDEDRDDEALAALARIADTSVFAKDRDRLKSSLASRALVRSLRAVENLLDQGRVDDALARAEAHVARFPDDVGGIALLARVQAAQAGAPSGNTIGLAPARQAFADGRLDDARTLATNAGYFGFAGDVERFERVLKEGTASLTRFDGAAARGPLDEAFRLLGSLGATATSPTFRAVQKPYADALYLSGTEKLAAGDNCGAAREIFKAARVLPGDARLEIELQKLQSIADQGLQKARATRAQDADRAGFIAREALCVARSGSATFEALQTLAR